VAKFNKRVKPAINRTVQNLANGPAYSLDAKTELTTLVLTSFLQDQFYRTANDAMVRIQYLAAKAGYEYAAKLAVYARREFGMRSVSHYIAALVAKHVKGQSWTKQFFSDVVRRADDITEIMSCYITLYGKPVPNSMKKGLGLALSKLNEYSLGKYKGDSNELSMVDVVNLVHPPHSEPIAKLVSGKLESADTWEVALTQAGQGATTPEEKELAKKKAWVSLVEGNKLQHFALLRNLRNIRDHASEVLPKALQDLVNREAIKKSLVMPFRYMTAIAEFETGNEHIFGGGRTVENPSYDQMIGDALAQAAEVSMDNIPDLDGHTVIAVDISGSMMPSYRDVKASQSPIVKAAVLAAALVKASTQATVILFHTQASFLHAKKRDSLMTIAQTLLAAATGGGTDLNCIFSIMPKCDRLVILSDMQSWASGMTGAQGFKSWSKKMDSDPFIYSIDLTGYGSVQFPASKVNLLAGYSDKIFDWFKYLESDKNIMIHTIESYKVVTKEKVNEEVEK